MSAKPDHAPLVVPFLHRVFIQPDVRLVAETDLAEAPEDDLFVLRGRFQQFTHAKIRPPAACDFCEVKSE